MQGTAADIIKKAMIDVDAWINDINDQDILMIMQVHDELVFEIKGERVDEYVAKIKSLMEETVTLDVPLVVDVGIGNNWDEAH
jgi:DNA polymerase-1